MQLCKCPDCFNIYASLVGGQEHEDGEVILPYTAYQFSLFKPTFVQRLMLNAKPDMNIQRYRELNYNARKMGMFLGFIAKTADDKLLSLKLNYDVFRVIISFL